MNQTKDNLKSFILLLAIAILCLPMNFAKAVFAQSDPYGTIIAPIQGLKAFDAPESYGPDTLWEKINGQAEFYLPAGFESLQSQMYRVIDNADLLIEVNIYNMGNPANAFSVYSLQKRDGAAPIAGVSFAYQTENAVYLAHGPFYVEIISMVPMGERMRLLNELALKFIKNTSVQSAGMDELKLFPRENQIQGSANMIPKDAFGYDQLDKVFTMAFQLGPDEVIAYISKRQSPAEAISLANGLYTYFKDFGAKDIQMSTSIKDARMIEIMGTYEIIFAFDNYCAGVHAAPTQNQAESLVRTLAESLRMHKAKQP